VLCVIFLKTLIYQLIVFQYLESLIERTPDLYLRELKVDLEENRGVSVDTSTIYRTLHRRGFSLKKNNFVASERVEDNRARFQIEVSENYHPEQLVFVDECAVNRLTTRRPRGWAPIGCRSRRRDFFIHGTR
jgi:Fe2+ or Zn2+ uptake regulation protein